MPVKAKKAQGEELEVKKVTKKAAAAKKASS